MTSTLPSSRTEKPLARLRGPLTSLSDQVWEQLRSDIIYGALEPGERIVELKVAEQMGTSQGPVREALGRLEYEGLVERHARSGTFVTAISHDEMFELFSVRALVEHFAIRRAVAKLDDTQIDELSQIVDLMRDAADRNEWGELVEYDMSFHLRICEWSGSKTLHQIWLPLYSQIQRFITHTHPRYFSDLHEIAEAHQPVLTVLKAHDAQAAGDLIQEHVMLVWSKIGDSDEVEIDAVGGKTVQTP